MPHKRIWLLLVGIGCLIALWLPTDYPHRDLFPTDDPKYIRRVYDSHTVGQTFHTKYETDSLRIIVRGNHPATQTLHAAVAGQDTSTVVSLTEEDQWITLELPEPVPVGEYQLTLSAPEIKSQTDAILVRFQIDSTNFEPGYMVVDGEPSYGDIAFVFVDRVPAWAHIPRYFVHHPNHAFEISRVLLLTAVFTSLAFILPLSGRGWRYAVFGLLVFSVAIRIPTLARIDGVFGGDAFNYLSKSKAWLSGDDPFSADPRKAPFLPFLLLPTFLTNDPLLWSRFLGAMSAGIAAAAVAVTLKRLRVMPALALLGGMLVAVNREMWWESLNGLANVPYAALIALSTLGLVQNAPFSTGIFTTLATLTRYEGILVSAVYLPALWLKNRFRLSMLRRSLVPLILLAVPFVFWPITGALGVRTAGDIVGDTGLYIAWDWGDYANNLVRVKLFLQELWFFRHEPPLRYVTYAIYAATLLGAAVLTKRRPAVGISLIVATLLQIAAVTAILPKTRYYVQIIPLLAIGFTYALNLLPRRTSIIIAALFVASVWVNTLMYLPGLYEVYNHKGRTDSPLIQSAVFFNTHGGKPAFAINFLPVETYMPRSQVIFGAPETEAEQLAWLREKQATHLVEVTEYPWFEELLAKYPQHFIHVTSFKASYDPAEATIYKIIGL